MARKRRFVVFNSKVNQREQIQMTTYWQVAAGDDSRDYVDEFLKYGIAFVGNPQRYLLNNSG